MKRGWVDEGHQSVRWTEKFAWLPVKTADAGWIWLTRFWREDRIWGWGFHEKNDYVVRPISFHVHISEKLSVEDLRRLSKWDQGELRSLLGERLYSDFQAQLKEAQNLK